MAEVLGHGPRLAICQRVQPRRPRVPTLLLRPERPDPTQPSYEHRPREQPLGGWSSRSMGAVLLDRARCRGSRTAGGLALAGERLFVAEIGRTSCRESVWVAGGGG